VEGELWGATHADVGAYLLGLWGLPDRVVEAVACHHEPRRAAPAHASVVAATWLAGWLVRDADTGQPDVAQVEPLDTAYLAEAGFDVDVEALRARVRESSDGARAA